jgi:hypothetical protein
MADSTEIARNELDKRREYVRPDLHGHHKVYQGFQQAFAALAEMDVDDDAEPDIGIAMSDLMDIAATGMKRTAEDAGERVEFSDPPQF